MWERKADAWWLQHDTTIPLSCMQCPTVCLTSSLCLLAVHCHCPVRQALDLCPQLVKATNAVWSIRCSGSGVAGSFAPDSYDPSPTKQTGDQYLHINLLIEDQGCAGTSQLKQLRDNSSMNGRVRLSR